MVVRKLALAACASCSVASAQSLTLYGVADAAVEVVSATGATAGPALDRRRKKQLGSDSYVGLRGSERLDGGTFAVFQLEGDLALDTGEFDEFTRDTFVGLQNPRWGDLRLGRNTPPMRALGESFDLTPGGDTGIGAIQSLLGINGRSTGAEDRRPNSVRYRSAGFWGARLDFVYEAGESPDAAGLPFDTALENPVEENGDTFGIGTTFGRGRFFAGYAYDVRKDSGRPGRAQVGGKEIRHRAGFKYGVLSNLMLGAFYDKASSSGVFDTGTGKIRKETWGAIGQWDSGPHSVYVMLVKARPLQCSGATGGNGVACASAADTGARLATLGYNYALGKRTLLRAALSFIDNDAAGRYDFSNGGVGA
ncbi:MAG: porin, partial [Gammaproteobacteria bacterium]